MSAPCHCSREKTARAVKNGAGWIIPGVVLALMPKCPLCLAAWISLLLGIGVTTSTATALHGGVILLCVVLVTFFLVRQLLMRPG
ncbi:hypothetical protein [Brevifollis gellanilyticus]|uniref:Uncharacterized protein n=1 Tax=Brevifollis gellanilyticus TaxID=748831 RepID=A0A512MEY8_9BACT|nr:hypothetical protein [Brevifollis gellanilyticus]GEP45310.1 hypothetical protein BGE01nite_46010 [Brevifollis gellanilyticus]